MVKWDEAVATESPITGYRLYMSQSTDQYEVIYEDTKNSLKRDFNATDL
jgi:hypothetical protein